MTIIGQEDPDCTGMFLSQGTAATGNNNQCNQADHDEAMAYKHVIWYWSCPKTSDIVEPEVETFTFSFFVLHTKMTNSTGCDHEAVKAGKQECKWSYY